MYLPNHLQQHQRQRHAGVLSMLKEPQGSDAFARLLEKEGALSPLAKLHSGPAKLIKFTTVPLAAVGGFLATPAAAGGLFRVFGGVVGGLALKTVNQKLRSMRHAGAEVAVAHLLLDYESDIGSLTPSAVKAVTSRYDVEYSEHLEIMRTMYTEFLLATLQWPEVRMHEPTSLVELSAALGLDSSTIGDAHCAAAEEIARRLTELPFEEQEEAWEQGMVSKLLFLSDRLYTQLEEEETREYELGRVTEILGLTPKEGTDRIQALVLPYYTSIVKSGVKQVRTGEPPAPGMPALDGQKLLQWRQSLGLSEVQASRLHSGEFAKEVTRCVEAGSGRVRDGDAEVLSKIRGLLGISSFEAERALESVTAPLLRQSIVEMLTSLTASSPDTWPDALHKVRQRQKELKMVDSALVFHIKDVYRERLKGLVRQAGEAALPLEAGTAADAEGSAGKLRKTVGAAMLLMRLMRQFLEVNNLEEVMDENLFELHFLGLLPGELLRREREVTFRQYVAAVVGAKLVDEEGRSITELGDFLEMDASYVTYTLKSLVGPIYEERVRKYVDGNQLTDSNSAALLDVIRDFRVDDADVRRIGLAVYTEKAHKFFDGKKHFTEPELAELEKLRGFLLLSNVDVDRVHEPLARPEFMSVLKEEFARQKKATDAAAEAGTGAPSVDPRVAKAGKDKIMALSRKLGLSEDARDDLIGEAMTDYVHPMLATLKTSYRRVTTPPAELAEQGGKDEGEDPFIKARSKDGLMIKTERNSNLMVDAVNLVKFLEENDGYKQTSMNLDDENHMAKKSAERPKRTVTSYICKAAMGGGGGSKSSRDKDEDADDSKLAEDMYKAFVQTVAAAPEGEKKTRYRTVQDKFGAALGIHPPRMEALKFDLYATQMRKLVRQCLEVKGMMGAEDNAKLSGLNKNYDIAEDRAARLVLAEKKKWLAGTLVSLIQSPPNIMGPTINKLRTTAANMGIDLSEDVPELTAGNKEFLFAKEVAWLLEMGPEDADAETITDAVEQFGVEEGPANRILEKEFNEASRQTCVDLMGNMERADYLGAFKDLGRLVRIGRCVPLPLSFGQEAFLGMAVCAEIRRVWSAYATLLGKTSAGAAAPASAIASIDLSALIQGLPESDLAAFKAGFEEEDSIVSALTAGLEALPDSGADVNLNIDYRGRKVNRKRPDNTDGMLADTKEEWEAGEIEYLEKGTMKIIYGEDGEPMTILDIIRKAIDTRHTFMGQKKRRTGPRKKGEKPVNAQGRRAA